MAEQLQATTQIPKLEEWVKAQLEELANKDPMFMMAYTKPKKKFENCIKYIFQRARELANKANSCAVWHDDVLSWAIHYYDEDDLAIDKQETPKPQAQVKTGAKPKPSTDKKNIFATNGSAKPQESKKEEVPSKVFAFPTKGSTKPKKEEFTGSLFDW